jgi:hypothetical protein
MRRRCRRAAADYAPPFHDLFRHDYYFDIALRFAAMMLVCFLRCCHFLHAPIIFFASLLHIYAEPLKVAAIDYAL